MKKFIVPVILVLALAGLFAVVAANAPKVEKSADREAVKLPENPECETGEDTFSCYERFYKVLSTGGGVSIAMEDMKERYALDSFVTSQCHQLVHVVGRTAGSNARDLSEAFAVGDSFCWSGYYHGVVEAFIQKGGKKVLSEGEGLNSVCKALKEARPYSFDHYNCVHGLGHGIMAIKYNELFDSLKICDLLTDSWDRESCFGGTYMENIMADGREHKTSYLKPDDPLYPCNAVDEAYRGQCYLMQTSYMLKVVGYDFAKVFELCDSVGDMGSGTNEIICYQSLGRDASGHSVSDPVRTKASCLLGKTKEQRENCVVGAVKDFISYFHSDTQAKVFCELLPDTLSATCLSTAESYYATF
ncbi:hypothetical protein L0Y69_01995 [bacterium]|nr:hypothetical protein [bacterium]